MRGSLVFLLGLVTIGCAGLSAQEARLTGTILESHTLQFRSEFFNVLNRPNFGNPGTDADAPGSYGRIAGAGAGDGDGCVIQFGLKYLF